MADQVMMDALAIKNSKRDDKKSIAQIDKLLNDWLDPTHDFGMSVVEDFRAPMAITVDYIDKSVESDDVAAAKIMKTVKKIRIQVKKLARRISDKRSTKYKLQLSRHRLKEHKTSEAKRKATRIDYVDQSRRLSGHVYNIPNMDSIKDLDDEIDLS